MFNHIQDGPFWGCSQMGGGAKRPFHPKICHTYPTMMKLGSYSLPKKIQKAHQSRVTHPESC